MKPSPPKATMMSACSAGVFPYRAVSSVSAACAAGASLAAKPMVLSLVTARVVSGEGNGGQIAAEPLQWPERRVSPHFDEHFAGRRHPQDARQQRQEPLDQRRPRAIPHTQPDDYWGLPAAETSCREIFVFRYDRRIVGEGEVPNRRVPGIE